MSPGIFRLTVRRLARTRRAGRILKNNSDVAQRCASSSTSGEKPGCDAAVRRYWIASATVSVYAYGYAPADGSMSGQNFNRSIITGTGW